MKVVKGYLVAFVAFGAGFISATVAESYLPGEARDYRLLNDALVRENDALSELNRLRQIAAQRRTTESTPNALENEEPHS